MTPVKTYLAQGFLLTGGTDSSVVPLNPWWAMYHFITRDTISDGVYGPDERVVNREDVLRLFTLNYAKLLHELSKHDRRCGCRVQGRLRTRWRYGEEKGDVSLRLPPKGASANRFDE